MKRIITQSLLFLTYAIFAAAWVSGSMLTPYIQADFSEAGLASASWGSNMITLAKIIGNLMAAYLLVKLGSKRAVSFAMLLVAIGGAGAYAMGYDQWLLSRLIVGFGGALIIVYFNPYVVHYFSAEERPIINGINAAAFNTGNLLALLSTSWLLEQLGSWQMVVQVYLWVPIGLLVLWLLLTDTIEVAKTAEAKAPETETLRSGLKDKFNWFLPLAYSGVLFCYISIFAVFPLLDGFAVKSTHLTTMLIASGMAGTVVGILAVRRLPFRLPILKVCGALLTISAAAMIGTTSPVIAYVAAACAGFFMFVPMTALVTLPQELPDMTPGRITVIFGMFWSISYGVETLMMWGASTLADTLAQPSLLAWIAVAMSSTLFIFSFVLPETGKEKSA